MSLQPPQRSGPGDVLVIWNRYGWGHEVANGFERDGGRVLVAENGYLGHGGGTPKFQVHPHGPKPDHFYALAEGYHNGAGRWPEGSPERFRALGVELKPWRSDGDHVLVCPNRSFGVGAQVMNPQWAERCAELLTKQTKRPVLIRPHPGHDAPRRTIADDLKDAWAVVVWSSSVAVHALLEGIPTFIEAPFQVVKGASATGTVDEPVMPERLPYFERLASAQWTCEEIEIGLPFKALLGC